MCGFGTRTAPDPESAHPAPAGPGPGRAAPATPANRSRFATRAAADRHCAPHAAQHAPRLSYGFDPLESRSESHADASSVARKA